MRPPTLRPKNPAPLRGRGVSLCAPGRVHLLGGESPLHARHGEVLAEGKGVAGDCESEGSLEAKRWRDEQEADRGGTVG